MLLRKSLAAKTRRPWFLSSGRCAEVLGNLKLGSSWALLCFITLLSLGTAHTYAGGFITAPTYPAGIQPLSVAVDDFNGDGIPDVAVANFDSLSARSGVSILLGKGDGSFQAPQSYVVGATAYTVAVSDFNGDGRSDLVVTGSNGEGHSTVSVLLGNGDGTFQAPLSFVPGPGGSGPIAVGDFNGDGILDLAVSSVHGFSIFLGNGDGTFHGNGVSYTTGGGPGPIAVGDFNGDGIADLAIASREIDVFLGNGDGTFRSAGAFAAGNGPGSVAVGDFNGDGILDLAVTDYGNGPRRDENLSILLGNGDGTFRAAQSYTTGLPSYYLAVADFNGDGHLDIAVGGESVVIVLLGRGDGTFQGPVFYAAAGSILDPLWRTPVAVGDFNQDGILDVVAVNESGTVSILLGRGDGTFHAAPCYLPGGSAVAVGDFNGDGIPDLALAESRSVSILLGKGDGTFQNSQSYAARDYGALAVADFNGDGKLDLVTSSGSVLLGNGDGTFQPAITLDTRGNSVAVGDFNGDGKLDIVMTSFALEGDPRHPKITHSQVRVSLGNGDGTFQPPQAYAVGASAPNSVAVGDFDGDGNLDLAVARDAGTIILLGNGDGSFRVAQTYGTGLYSQSVVVGDFNGDGRPGLVVTSAFSNTVTVLLGHGDGTFQAGRYVVGAYPYSVATGDFNQDGILDVAVAHSTGVSVLLGNGDGTFQTAQSYAAGPGGQIAVADFNNDGFPDLVLASDQNVLTILLNAP